MKARRLPNSHSRTLTLKEWGELPAEVPGELVDGVLEGEEVTTEIHDALAMFLANLFWDWVRRRGGQVFPADRKYAVTAKRGRKPDISVFFSTTKLTGTGRVTAHPPDIAIEVVTATPRDARRDRVEKRGEYARFGVRWYWLVDPAIRTVEILELDSKHRYTHVADGTIGKLRVPGCKGLVLDLDDLWSEADRLAK